MEQMIKMRDMYNIVVQKINNFGLQRQVGLYLMKHGSDGKVYRAKIEWVEVNPLTDGSPSIVEHVGMVEKSTLETAIQNASEPVPIDSLTGKLEATEKHLEDMRRLVFEEAPTVIRDTLR